MVNTVVGNLGKHSPSLVFPVDPGREGSSWDMGYRMSCRDLDLW